MYIYIYIYIYVTKPNITKSEMAGYYTADFGWFGLTWPHFDSWWETEAADLGNQRYAPQSVWHRPAPQIWHQMSLISTVRLAIYQKRLMPTPALR